LKKQQRKSSSKSIFSTDNVLPSCDANYEKVNRFELPTGFSGALTPKRPRSKRR
jgi:hypothetical protein